MNKKLLMCVITMQMSFLSYAAEDKNKPQRFSVEDELRTGKHTQGINVMREMVGVDKADFITINGHNAYRTKEGRLMFIGRPEMETLWSDRNRKSHYNSSSLVPFGKSISSSAHEKNRKWNSFGKTTLGIAIIGAAAWMIRKRR